jgi:hypothetical protein
MASKREKIEEAVLSYIDAQRKASVEFYEALSPILEDEDDMLFCTTLLAVQSRKLSEETQALAHRALN